MKLEHEATAKSICGKAFQGRDKSEDLPKLIYLNILRFRELKLERKESDKVRAVSFVLALLPT